jgi:DNA-binding NtrC family response regulator
MLENLRFYPGEQANDPAFARALADLADCYVNDAFGSSHREHASIVGVPALLPSAAGCLMQRELEMLGLPPLRERAEDIPELAQRLFARIREKHNRPDLRLPNSLLPLFRGYEWPGNVRELENVIERLVVLTPGSEISIEDLPEHLRRGSAVIEELRLDLPAQGISLESVEKELILRALKKFQWNQTHAAQYLDISRRTLIYRMEKYGIRKDDAAG